MIYDDNDLRRLALAVTEVCAQVAEKAADDYQLCADELVKDIRALAENPTRLLHAAAVVTRVGPAPARPYSNNGLKKEGAK